MWRGTQWAWYKKCVFVCGVMVHYGLCVQKHRDRDSWYLLGSVEDQQSVEQRPMQIFQCLPPYGMEQGDRWQPRLWELSQRVASRDNKAWTLAALWSDSYTEAAVWPQSCWQVIITEWSTAWEQNRIVLNCDWCRLISSVPRGHTQDIHKDRSPRFYLIYHLHLSFPL